MRANRSQPPLSYNEPDDQRDTLQRRFGCYLLERGHAASTVTRYGAVLRHFTHYLRAHGLDARAATPEHVETFLDGHLSRCCCQGAHPWPLKTNRAALRQLLGMLGYGHRRRVWSVAIDDELDAYDHYSDALAGLAETTRHCRRRYAGEFLFHHFGTKPLNYDDLSSVVVRAYITHRGINLAPPSVAAVCVAVRSFLRFVRFSGRCQKNLADAIPGGGVSRRQAPPRGLDEASLRRLVASFDRTTSTGRRDYAMCRCLIDLGMRTSEVALLRLDDVDWHGGTIRLRASKSRNTHPLPLPPTTGEAIVDYLRCGRPATTARSVFVHHRSLSGTPVTAPTVRGAVRRGFARAGIAPSLSQVHRLRHSAAARLLEVGTPFKTIADILNHRSYDTTLSYMALDTERLRDVAMPWPEYQS